MHCLQDRHHKSGALTVLLWSVTGCELLHMALYVQKYTLTIEVSMNDMITFMQTVTTYLH